MEHDLSKVNSSDSNLPKAANAEQVDKLIEAIKESARVSLLANEINFQYINGNLDSSPASAANESGVGDMSLQVINKRRNAIRQKNVHDKNGHKFVVKYFTQPTRCFYCEEAFWGINKPGFHCQLCHCNLHQKCCNKILSLCRKNPIILLQITQNPNRLSVNVPHQFSKNLIRSFTFCDHCGQIMRMFRHEFKCNSCGFTCHKSCSENCAHNCGVNEKQISEILSNIVKKRPRRVQIHEMNFIHKLEPKIEKLPQIFHKSRQPTEQTNRNGHTSHNPSRRNTSAGGFNAKDAKSGSSTLNEIRSFKLGLKDFVIQKVIGRGSFGKVLLVTRIAGNSRPGREREDEFYALKCIKKDSILQDDNVGSIMVERDILKLGSKNPFITRSEAAFQNQEYVFFLMEFLNGGDLMFHIVDSIKFTEDRARFYAAEILCGLQFLHNEGIIYRDLKLDNVLLDSAGHCKISDFGMCKKIEPNGGKAQTFCGTPDYIAPEILRGQMYNFSVDFWSFGVLLYEMLTGFSPFHGRDEEELFRAIQNANIVYPNHMSKEAKSFIAGLLDRDPETRLGMKQSSHGLIREHEYFKQIDWSKLESAQIEPPFKPNIKTPSDVSNFDSDFTSESPRLSISADSAFMLDDDIFKGFSFIGSHLVTSLIDSNAAAT